MPSVFHSHDKFLYTIHDLLEWQPSSIHKIIYEGVLEVGTRLWIYGDEGSWKSAEAIHAAYSIARGSNWFGFHTEPANCLYIQGEMSMHQQKIRMEKYCVGSRDIFNAKHIPDNPSGAQLDSTDSRAADFAYPTNVVIKSVINTVNDFQSFYLDETSGLNSLKGTIDYLITEFPDLPLVVILDPLFKMFRRELADAADAGYFVENMDKLLHTYPDRLAFMVVHHSRKPSMDKDGNILSAGSADMFGSAKLKWAADCMISSTLEPTDESKTTVKLEFTKHSRVASGFLPKLITARWNKDTLHPRILARIMPTNPEEESELRGLTGLVGLE